MFFITGTQASVLKALYPPSLYVNCVWDVSLTAILLYTYKYVTKLYLNSESSNMKFEYVVVYENISDMFNNGHCRIKVKAMV